nr:kinesin-like protein KIN-14Q isoform X2 [Tanacetum cinerariifolium]
MNDMGSIIQSKIKQHEDLKIKFNEGAKERKELYNKIHKLKGNIRVFCSKDGELSVKSNVAYKKNLKFDSVFSLKQPKVYFSSLSGIVELFGR